MRSSEHRRARAQLAFAGALGTAGCQGRQSTLDPRGPEADVLYELSSVLFIGSAIIFVLVIGFLIAAFLKRPKQVDDQNPEPEVRYGRARVRTVVVAVAATAVTLITLLLYNLGVSRALEARPENPLEIEVVGHQWWWEVTYLGGPSGQPVRTANELHIPVNRPVSIRLKSRDVIHSFWVPNLQGKVDMIPGRINNLVMEAREPGIYRGQCAEFCGLQHAKMAFYVVAEPAPKFEAWLTHQASAAIQPQDALAEAGQKIFLGGPCALCHAVRGTLAMGSAGPDLTHIASRLSLGSGELANTRGNLAGWILDPQHVKPGTRMPASHLDRQSTEALLHYLQALN